MLRPDFDYSNIDVASIRQQRGASVGLSHMTKRRRREVHRANHNDRNKRTAGPLAQGAIVKDIIQSFAAAQLWRCGRHRDHSPGNELLKIHHRIKCSILKNGTSVCTVGTYTYYICQNEVGSDHNSITCRSYLNHLSARLRLSDEQHHNINKYF
ncbi:Hypothetical predicted protein [Octopus vulgaris]|uniref:Uncharacterized protein n=1 Tax=Octopus vulgaris TaxID=6645 RepID=A0AA36FLZ4_OCTVU|nr:Hypothetical predicted protein [Octopus vulgaris]